MLTHFDLKDIFDKQAELDLEICKKHDAGYETTKSKRLLALLVELGEFANATRTFKFWSNKPSESKERVLDEYADGLHFITSLGIAYDFKVYSFDVLSDDLDLTSTIINCYRSICAFSSKPNKETYINAFSDFLKIIEKIYSSKEEVIDAYYKKLAVNYQRQNNNY